MRARKCCQNLKYNNKRSIQLYADNFSLIRNTEFGSRSKRALTIGAIDTPLQEVSASLLDIKL